MVWSDTDIGRLEKTENKTFLNLESMHYRQSITKLSIY